MSRIQRSTQFALRPSGAHTTTNTHSSVLTLTAPSDPRATVLIMQNTTTYDAGGLDIRYTLDGTDPTPSKGFLLEDGDSEVRWDFARPLPTIKAYLVNGARLDYQWFVPG